MNSKIFFRTLSFLLLLLITIYVAIVNTHTIAFHFPLLLDKPISAPAALIFFVLFAVGVFGGTLLNAGGGGGAKSGGKENASKRK